jgi:GNAT superfamily N-acetyltransferase
VRIKLRTAGLDDITSIYAIRRDSILGVLSEASLSDSPEERLLFSPRRCAYGRLNANANERLRQRQRQAWADQRSPNYYQDRITAGHVVIASFEEDNIGWGSSSDDYITGLYVCSSWYRRGIGRIIMDSLEMEILRRGYTYARLGSSPDAVGFYTKLGYESVGFPDEDRAVPMKKHLKITDSKSTAV